MPRDNRVIDTVRPSREGHEFHEAWTARKAMQLLMPKDDLIGIAVEGLEEEDQSRASPGTVEVADLTVYYGKDANFKDAHHVETLQFKYSPKLYNRQFRASDAKKTITKFAESYQDYKRNYGAASVTEKLSYQLITNRPIFPALYNAIEGISKGKQLTGYVKKQGEQFKKAAGLNGKELVEFAGKCRVIGLAGSLQETKTDLSKIIVDWSATTDARAKARLGSMRDMVRKKAGFSSEYKKVIRQVDVLDALELSDISDLLPCPSSLANIGKIVKREQLEIAATLVPSLVKPLLIHAAGGIGKTVFMDSLASLLSDHHEVVFFDCFGGGAYRSPEDARHLPSRGLVHIANVLACRGLCDPILPGSDNVEMLFGTFRKRLRQCVRTLTTVSSKRGLILFIDAIDNAACHAFDFGQPSFPTLLLESFQHSGAVSGVKLVVSCRSHRIEKSIRDVHYVDFNLRSFSLTETDSYLKARLTDVSETEIQVAQARSDGNARILEHLVTSDRGLLDQSEIDQPIDLDDLLTKRIDDALAEALNRGYKKTEIDAFLAGLSVLPPPVPLEEYAGAHGMNISAIKSFAADLAPLLEWTQQGMTFRDEPTETLVRESYGTDNQALKRVAQNLHARQEESVYAARALPGLLQKLKDGKMLFKLAFDERFPAAITSTVGRRRIRSARLKSAVLHAANNGDSNGLVRLLVELSTITASDQKGADFILENPDLVVNAQDVDALRRLFETRTKWPGARHARLTIANILSGDLDDASRHFSNAVNWMRHDFESGPDKEFHRARPKHIDRAAIPLLRVIQGRPKPAISFMRLWYPWYGYEISEHFFSFLRQAIQNTPKHRRQINNFIDSMTTEIGCLAGALSFIELTEKKRLALVGKLANACKRATKLMTSGRLSRKRKYELQDGLRKAAAIASSLGQRDEALKISYRAPHKRPSIWNMVDLHSEHDVLPFLFRVALESAVKGNKLYEYKILPSDLVPFCKGISRKLPVNEFKKKLNQKIEKQMQKERDTDDPGKSISIDLKQNIDRFLSYRWSPLFKITEAFADFLGSPLRKADRPFQNLIDVWVEVRKLREMYYHEQQINSFFQQLGIRMAVFALWARSDLKAVSVRKLLKHLHEQQYLNPETLIDVIAIISIQRRFHLISGEEAIKAKALIDREDDVAVRASLYAKLARAILPASASEATEYFKIGLEQLDAIGSGDYEFTNELLIFASSLKGDELNEQDFHTLMNICELNMSYDEEKFPWAVFGSAMSRISGFRGLAKLSRWHDRGKITLDYTLLPYLTALIGDEKIAQEDALALNRLANPAELWACNTETFANSLHAKRFPNEKNIISELIQQYENNNPDISSMSTIKALSSIAGKLLGKRNRTTQYLSTAHKHFDRIGHDFHLQNKSNLSSGRRLGRFANSDLRKIAALKKIVTATNPVDEVSLCDAINYLAQERLSRELEQEFFNNLRVKVPFKERLKYVKLIARLDHIDKYAKLHELKKCKQEWAGSSVALNAAYQSLAAPILEIHAEEFLSYDRLSGYQIQKVSDLTGVPLPALAIQLVKVFAQPDWTVHAAAWLGLSSIINEDSDEGSGQKALSRLLNSSSAKLSSKVADGPWKHGLYPPSDISAVASGLIWQMLGSPRVSDRWLAAHSIRCFARLGRWVVLDTLIARYHLKESKSFQAPELPFYYLHARLWLLIALARVALDAPEKVAKHSRFLEKIALDQQFPHVLLKHFATKALLACEAEGALEISDAQKVRLNKLNTSPFPPLNEKQLKNTYSDFYKGRPDDVQKPEFEFYLEYDFNKYEVHGLADVFGLPGWKIQDLISEEVHKLDPDVTTIYEDAGRVMPSRRSSVGLKSWFHIYGHYLAWHALRIVAGRLLEEYPTAKHWHYENPWTEWLNRKLITRSDGYWLSDGMDRPPLRNKINVLEEGKEGLVLTGNRDKLMSFVGIDEGIIGDKVVVEGDWKSLDGVNVYISSVLVPVRKAKRLSEHLIKEEPFHVWLPTLEYDDDESVHFRREKLEYNPWIVRPSIEGGRFDQYDPLSVIAVERRPRFVKKIINEFSLKSGDPFQRSWRTPRRKIVATTDAWGYDEPDKDRSDVGVRLVCKSDFLRNILELRNACLLLLIKLRRYEDSLIGHRKSKFSNTVAVIQIRKNLKFKYFAGAVNHVLESRF